MLGLKFDHLKTKINIFENFPNLFEEKKLFASLLATHGFLITMKYNNHDPIYKIIYL